MAFSQHHDLKVTSADIHSLAAVSNLINSYLVHYKVAEEDEIKFIKLLDRIRAIETICTGWFKAEYKKMSKAEYFKKIEEDKKKIINQLIDTNEDSDSKTHSELIKKHIETQEELNFATDYAQQNLLNFFDIAVKKLWEDINKKPDLKSPGDMKDNKEIFHVRDLTKFDLSPDTKLPQAQRYIVQNPDTVKARQNLFKKINESLVIIIKNNDPDFDEKKLPLEKEHKRSKLLLSYYNYPENRDEYYAFASELGARYIKYQQTTEPLRFTNKVGIPKGSCFAHVIKWAEEIKTNGIFLSFPYNDHTTQTIQSNQDQYRQKGIIEHFRNHIDTMHYNSHLDILSIFDTILDKVGNDIYLIDLIYKNNGAGGHSVGIRKIPHTGEVEFFDPNFGIFVFPNMAQLKTWLTLHFLNCYYNNNSGQISLTKIASQSLTAKASILPIKIPESKGISIPSLKYKVSNNKYSTKYYETLKNNVCAVIDTEITRLNAAIIKKSFSQEKIAALNVLKKFITNAPKDVTLTAIVARWLAAPSKKNPLLKYRDVIEKRRHAFGDTHSNTFNFVIHLTKNHEISPYQLETLEEKVLNRIQCITKQDWT